MAFFYNPTFYHTDLTDYDSYDSYYDSSQTEPPISRSSNEPTFYNLFDYPTPCYSGEAYDSGVGYSATHGCYGSNFNKPQVIEYDLVDHEAYDFAISYTANACSASTFSVPKVIEYDPGFCGDGYHNQKVSTQFVISYSVSEFNEPEFEEYDPTPYDGGYDIYQTYGKPLPPSNEICYQPSSSSSSSAPKPPPQNDASPKGSIELQKGNEEIAEEAAKGKIGEQTKPAGVIKPTQIQEDEDSSSSDSEADESQITEVVSSADPGSGSGYENGRVAEGDYEYGRAVNQFPSGYGLEAMDLCETLFGYWPCLSRIKKPTGCRRANSCGHCHGYHSNHNNQWQTAADYLFGSHYPYPDGRGGQGDPVYGYDRHHQGEPLYGYVWLNNFNRSEDV